MTEKISLFTPASLEFLSNLVRHNQKAWFEAHRGDYEQAVLAPLRSLVAALAPCIVVIDPSLEVTPAVNKTISRIQRDTRFAKDKSPYKTNQWISFKRAGQNWAERPAFFFEFGPWGYRYGMGYYGAPKPALERMREELAGKTNAFAKMVKPIGKAWRLEGEEYKRLPVPELPEPLLAWYRKKNLYLVRNFPVDDRLFSPNLAETVGNGFLELAEVYHFLVRISA